ncbi:MAG: AAA family ATPase, partial [Prevotella sp.]|nr:AAA family ATPase [Prevotella sp.]
MEIKLNTEIEIALNEAINIAKRCHHEYLTPEHLLLSMLRTTILPQEIAPYGDEKLLEKELWSFVDNMEKTEGESDAIPEFSSQMNKVLVYATRIYQEDDRQDVDIPMMLRGILQLEDSWAAYLLKKTMGNYLDEMLWEMETFRNGEQYDMSGNDTASSTSADEKKEGDWLKYVTCLNDIVDRHNPLIGRERELERTIQVLCRKDKNNPLHVGEAGVGKTALVYGLAARINSGDVPERLSKSKIYMMDMGTMVAGTQYRGDFEKRLKDVMEGASKTTAPIIYIDEIHNIVGAGKIEGSLDA